MKTRKRIGAGIRRDRYGLAARVKVGSGAAAVEREKRFPADTPFKKIRDWQESMRGELRAAQSRPASTARGTFEADAKVYLAQVKHLASYKSRVCEVDAWTALYGRLKRSQLTSEHVRKARATWTAASPSTPRRNAISRTSTGRTKPFCFRAPVRPRTSTSKR